MEPAEQRSPAIEASFFRSAYLCLRLEFENRCTFARTSSSLAQLIVLRELIRVVGSNLKSRLIAIINFLHLYVLYALSVILDKLGKQIRFLLLYHHFSANINSTNMLIKGI